MAGSLTDKLRKASGSTRPVVTSLALPKANGATTAELTSGTGWNTTTGVDVVMYRRQLNTTTGLYEKIDGTQTEWIGTLTGTTLTLPALPNAGTEPASGYAADGNTVVFCGPTSQWADDVIETMLTLFNQDQTLKPGPIQTALGLGAGDLNGWNALGFAPSTVTYNGNRSYDLVFTSQDLTGTLSPGMRLRTTNTVAAPTRCTSLNGTTQYYSKSSPAGMTFTDDTVAGAWIKISSYATASIISRYNGTSGWDLRLTGNGQVNFIAYNASSSNYSDVTSYQSVPLNKWVHVAAQLDMSAFTATTTTSYVMIDGVDVPASVTRGGTNPTALIQAGNLEIGSRNGGTQFFPGKIAQAFVSSTKITQANVRTLISQGITSALATSNSIVSAFSFDNAITDINTTNANNLTANGSAVATNADSFTGQQADGSISSTLNYTLVHKATFSTNTTLTVQVPEGCTIPTSGGVSAVVYSSNKVPYGMPAQKGKWRITTELKTQSPITSNATYGSFLSNGLVLLVPLGSYVVGYELGIYQTTTTEVEWLLSPTTSIVGSSSTPSDVSFATRTQGPTAGTTTFQPKIENAQDLLVATTYIMYTIGATTGAGTLGTTTKCQLYADNAYL